MFIFEIASQRSCWRPYGLWLAIGMLWVASALPLSSQPNVVIVLTDDQGIGDLGAHGHPYLKTPNLDALRAQSLRLTNFHVAPSCTPTRSQLMTGIDALHNGAYRPHGQYHLLNQDYTLLPEYFQRAGYQTALYGKWHLGGNSLGYRPHERGFDDTVHFLRGGHWSHPNPWNTDCMDDTYYHNGALESYTGYATDLWFALGKKFVQQATTDEAPFFLYLALNAPHVPWLVPARYREPYLGHGLDRESINFYGMISSLDEQLGQFIDYLKEEGQWENTIFLFFTDNGTALRDQPFNAGWRGKKSSVYEGGHRVPFFISWPAGNLPQGVDLDELVQVQDLLPTLLSMAQVPGEISDAASGTDISSLLTNGRQDGLDDRILIVQPRVDKWDASIMYRDWRLVNGTELYDLSADQAQENDVSGRHPEVVERLRPHYESWYAKRVTRPFPYFIRNDAGPLQLTAYDWYDGRRVFNWPHLRAGDRSNGKYLLHVEDPGRYRFVLSRWPREARAAIAGSVPPFMPFDEFLGPLPEGKAFDIRSAKVRIGDREKTVEVKPDDQTVNLEIELEAGETHLQTWFTDAAGESFGAFYVYIEPIP